MPPAESEVAAQVAVVSSQIKDLKGDFDQLRLELRERDALFVTKAEFEAWRTGIGREIGDVKASIATAAKSTDGSAKAPPTSGWVIAGVIVSGVVGMGALLAVVITLIRVIPNV